MKKAVFIAITAFMAVFIATVVSANPISVEIDGAPVVFEGQGPAVVDGRTLVPMRAVFEQLGFQVFWREVEQRIAITGHGFIVELTIGNTMFTIAGNRQPDLEVPPQIIGGSTMVPIRAILEGVNHAVDWDAETSTVVITTPLPPIPEDRWAPPMGPLNVVWAHNRHQRVRNASPETPVRHVVFASMSIAFGAPRPDATTGLFGFTLFDVDNPLFESDYEPSRVWWSERGFERNPFAGLVSNRTYVQFSGNDHAGVHLYVPARIDPTWGNEIPARTFLGVVREARLLPFEGGTIGEIAVQGSDDGQNWTTIWRGRPDLDELSGFYIAPWWPMRNIYNRGYSFLRVYAPNLSEMAAAVEIHGIYHHLTLLYDQSDPIPPPPHRGDFVRAGWDRLNFLRAQLWLRPFNWSEHAADYAQRWTESPESLTRGHMSIPSGTFGNSWRQNRASGGPASAMIAWMNSTDGHRQSVLSSAPGNAGIGHGNNGRQTFSYLIVY
ncbi:MAG: CAP domain-containing protein [Clostridiales bacterium]|jgi:hypothetical protein|nr:CAP domain-containing protein [Clostridiales bacterium]